MSCDIVMLSDSDEGRWAVLTGGGSLYEIDLDAGMAVRRPLSAGASELRRDSEARKMFKLIECLVGAPMKLYLDVGSSSSPTFTLRVTTPVVAIDHLPDA